jgi:hypothetical protein
VVLRFSAMVAGWCCLGLVGGKGAMPGVDSIAAAIAKLNVELRRWRTQG